MASTLLSQPLLECTSSPPQRRFKTSDLPLSITQRSSIESLLHTLKKNGGFDTLRKSVWSQYTESEAKAAFTTSLTELAECEIDREPFLLSRDRGKAATLIEGAVDRSNIYKSVEASIDALLNEHIGNAELAAREVRRQEVGEEAAAEEERLGSKTDEEYARDIAMRRDVRERIRKQEQAKRRREEEKERLRAEEKKKKLELEQLRKADERRKEEEARETQKRLEREAKRAQEMKIEEEREEAEREIYNQRKEERELERVGEIEREHKRGRTRSESSNHGRSRYRDSDNIPWGGDEGFRDRSLSEHRDIQTSPPEAISPVDEKALEKAALELLLKEGRELAAKSDPRMELERSESLEPPPRRGLPLKPKTFEFSMKAKQDSRSSSKLGVKSSRNYGNMPDGTSFFKHEYSRSPIQESLRGRRLSHEIPSRPHHRTRSLSPSRSRSRGQHSHRWETQKSNEDAWKKQETTRQEEEAYEYRHATKEGRITRSQSRSPSATRTHHRSDDRERSHRHHSHREYYESHRRHSSRSRSPAPKSSRYDRERSPARHRKSYHEGVASGRSTRQKSPVEIDRYVPGGGSVRPRVSEATGRGGEYTKERRHHEHHHHHYKEDGHRSREDHRDRYEKYDKYNEYDKYDKYKKYDHHDKHDRYNKDEKYDRYDKREKYEKYDKHHDKYDKYDKHEKHRYVEIDRYMPGRSGAGGGGGEDDGKKRKVDRDYERRMDGD